MTLIYDKIIFEVDGISCHFYLIFFSSMVYVACFLRHKGSRNKETCRSPFLLTREQYFHRIFAWKGKICFKGFTLRGSLSPIPLYGRYNFVLLDDENSCSYITILLGIVEPLLGLTYSKSAVVITRLNV